MKRDFVFNGAQNPGDAAFWIGMIVLAAVLIVVLLQQERKLVSGKVGFTMLLLRLAVLATLLLTFMQPVLTWTRDEELEGNVLIALDISESMSTADKQASQAEKLRWARALGMYGNDKTNERIDAWLAALDAGQEPEWVSESESADPTRRAELARARKENLEGVFAELTRLTRREIALTLLTGTDKPLLDQISEVAATEVKVFAGESETADATVLDGYVKDPPATIGTGLSDLSKALTATGDAPKGVVILTDGRDTSPRDPVGMAKQLGSLGVPVYPVVLGSTFRPRDLSISVREYPQTVFVNDTATVSADILASGFNGEALTINLTKDGEVVDQKAISADGTTRVDFELDATIEGRHKYDISVDVQDGETRDDNNSAKFAVTVVDDKARVLLVDGTSRWEFRFLHRALDRDERVEATSVVYDQPYIGQLNGPFFARELNLPENADDIDQTPLADIDVIIIGDLSPSKLNDKFLTLLEKYVAELGGTVVFQAGKKYMPLAYDSEILARLLPIKNASEVNKRGIDQVGPPQERGTHLFLTAEALDEPMFQFLDEPFENRRFWSRMPGHNWLVVAQAKPAATVFASVFDPDRHNAPDFERNNALIAHHYFGFGQVLWMGIDSTWRWRFRSGDRYHHRFWGQLARWAASNKASAGNDQVRLKLSGTELNQGEDLEITAIWSRAQIAREPDSKATIVITQTDADGKSRVFSEFDLQPEEGRTRAHTGRVAALPPGSFRVELKINGEAPAEPIFADFFVQEEKSLELSDVSCNRDLLQQIAEASGGRVFNADEIDQLPELLRSEAETESKTSETPLWNHWSMLMLFFGLMTLEWIVRKLSGLP